MKVLNSWMSGQMRYRKVKAAYANVAHSATMAATMSSTCVRG